MHYNFIYTHIYCSHYHIIYNYMRICGYKYNYYADDCIVYALELDYYADIIILYASNRILYA